MFGTSLGRSSNNQLTVTIFGANGFVGRYLVNYLGKFGTKIVAPFRGDQSEVMFLKPLTDLGNLVQDRFHLKDERSIKEAIQESHVVINLIVQDRKSFNFTQDETNIDGAERIAKIVRDCGKKRLIHLSHTCAVHDSPSSFFRSKWLGEQKVRSVYPEAVVVRPSQLFGNEDRLMNLFGVFSGLPFGIPVVKGGRAIRHPLYVGDLVECLGRLCQAEDVEGTTFDLHGPETYTMYDLARLFQYTAMSGSPIVSMPQILAWIYSKMYIDVWHAICTRDTVRQWTCDELLTRGHLTRENLGMVKDSMRLLSKSLTEYVRIYREPEQYNSMLPPIDYEAFVEGKSFNALPLRDPDGIIPHSNHLNNIKASNSLTSPA